MEDNTDFSPSATSIDKEPGHWIEELFPPTYTLTTEDVLKKEKEEREPSVYEKLARGRVGITDYERMKNVYERVWLMMRMKEEENEKDRLPTNDKSTQIPDLNAKYREVAKQELTVTEKLDDTERSLEQVDLNQSCIWNSEEIDVLRNAFKAFKVENNRLKAELRANEEEMTKIREKYKTQLAKITAKDESLLEAKKANQRLHILCKTLKADLDDASAQVEIFRNELSEIQSANKELSKQNHKLQLNSNKDRIARKKLETILTNQEAEVKRGLDLVLGKMKVKHDSEVGLLQKKIMELAQELTEEKKEHERTKKGLDHLRLHFAGVHFGTADEEFGPVTQDQLSSLNYK